MIYRVVITIGSGTRFTGWTDADDAEDAILKAKIGPMSLGWPDLRNATLIMIDVKPEIGSDLAHLALDG